MFQSSYSTGHLQTALFEATELLKHHPKTPSVTVTDNKKLVFFVENVKVNLKYEMSIPYINGCWSVLWLWILYFLPLEYHWIITQSEEIVGPYTACCFLTLLHINKTDNIQNKSMQMQTTEVLHKKGVLKNIAKFTGKHFSIMLQAEAWKFLSVNFAKIFKNTFFIEQLQAIASVIIQNKDQYTYQTMNIQNI